MQSKQQDRSIEPDHYTNSPALPTSELKSDQGHMPINRWALMLAGIILALGIGFGVGLLILRPWAGPVADVGPDAAPPAGSNSPKALAAEAAVPSPTQDSPDLPAAYLAQPSSAQEMFSEFICPCCGQSIGDCACGMADERRSFVSGLAAAKASRLDIYLAYAQEYGLDTFASWETKHVIRQHRLANAPAERPQIVLETQTVDLGDVSVREGKAETSIRIKNAGQKDLVVEGLSTSCGCTTVSVVEDGQEGPVFGAGAPPEDWSTTIRPGATAELRIYYDPSFHQDARGAIMRQVYVSTNDPIDPTVKVSIHLNQVD